MNTEANKIKIYGEGPEDESDRIKSVSHITVKPKDIS
mgnify:FL=1